jgi:hypothetical protein
MGELIEVSGKDQSWNEVSGVQDREVTKTK